MGLIESLLPPRHNPATGGYKMTQVVKGILAEFRGVPVHVVPFMPTCWWKFIGGTLFVDSMETARELVEANNHDADKRSTTDEGGKDAKIQ